MKKLYLLIPKPDLTFVLDVCPKESMIRKGNTRKLGLDDYKIQRNGYLNLAKKLDLEVLDAGQSPEKIVKGVVGRLK